MSDISIAAAKYDILSFAKAKAKDFKNFLKADGMCCFVLLCFLLSAKRTNLNLRLYKGEN
jgi:hypothetical protein